MDFIRDIFDWLIDGIRSLVRRLWPEKEVKAWVDPQRPSPAPETPVRPAPGPAWTAAMVEAQAPAPVAAAPAATSRLVPPPDPGYAAAVEAIRRARREEALRNMAKKKPLDEDEDKKKKKPDGGMEGRVLERTRGGPSPEEIRRKAWERSENERREREKKEREEERARRENERVQWEMLHLETQRFQIAVLAGQQTANEWFKTERNRVYQESAERTARHLAFEAELEAQRSRATDHSLHRGGRERGGMSR